MGSAFVIACLVVFSEVIDGYLLTRPRDTVALLGERVLLDCISNVSRSLVWHLRRHGSQSDVRISSGNEIAPNISDSFKILSNEVGQFVLVIDPVLMSLAGRYECDDREQVVPSFAHVTLLNGTPYCEESSASFPKKIVCSFGYAGNLTPELEWMTLGNSSWKVSCKASNAVVECVFESICTVNKLPSNANSFLTFCIEEHNTCEWGGSSSSVGLLRIKGYNKTVGSWHCMPTPTGVPTTTQLNSEETARNCSVTVIGLSTAVIILAASTIGFFVGFLIALKRIRKAKKEPITSSNITGYPNVKRTAEYEELLEAAQQSSGLPVYQNEPVLQTEYQELDIIDQPLQQSRSNTPIHSLY